MEINKLIYDTAVDMVSTAEEEKRLWGRSSIDLQPGLVEGVYTVRCDDSVDDLARQLKEDFDEQEEEKRQKKAEVFEKWDWEIIPTISNNGNPVCQLDVNYWSAGMFPPNIFGYRNIKEHIDEIAPENKSEIIEELDKKQALL